MWSNKDKHYIDNKNIKVLPLNLDSLFTPLAFAFFIMGDGSWDKSGSRIVLHVNNFTLIEVNKIQSILLDKFNISSYFIKTPHSFFIKIEMKMYGLVINSNLIPKIIRDFICSNKSKDIF